MAVDPREEHAEARQRIDESLTAIGAVRSELVELGSAFNLTGNYGMRDKCAKLAGNLERVGRDLAHSMVLIERADLAVQTERKNNGPKEKSEA